MYIKLAILVNDTNFKMINYVVYYLEKDLFAP